MEPWHESLEDAYRILRGQTETVRGYDSWEKEGIRDEEHPLAPYQTTEVKKLRIFVPAKDEGVLVEGSCAAMEGRLIGGCMDCLVNLTGTKYDKVREFAEHYKEDGLIWFLESCDLNVMGIRRAVWQMKNAGWFSHVKGFLIGRPLIFGQEMMGLDQYRAVWELLQELRVPVIMDADIGHLPPMLPLICGSYAKVNASGDALEVTMKRQ